MGKKRVIKVGLCALALTVLTACSTEPAQQTEQGVLEQQPEQQQQEQPPLSLQAQAQGVFEQNLSINSELLLLVSENPLEPRSIGSYTVKAYAVDNPELPYDRFIAGLVRPGRIRGTDQNRRPQLRWR